jgi:hypothetical protein
MKSSLPLSANNPPLNGTKGSIRRKASIEIYFVLYLSAIILLLGTSPAKKSNRTADLEATIMGLLAPNFEVKANRAALLYYFVPASSRVDTSGVDMRRDSMNVIFAVGQVSDVEFNIVSIVDSATGRELPLDRATLVKDGERRSIFQWTPLGEKESAVYSVTVEGRARPIPPANIAREDLRQQINEFIDRQGYISDSVTFTVNLFAINGPVTNEALQQTAAAFDSVNSTTATSAAPPGLTSSPSFASAGGLSISADENSVAVPPRSGWRNKILIGGADPSELILEPVIGDVREVGRGASWIEVGGSAPASGQERITVRVRRRNGGAALQASFDVNAMALAQPDVPSELYRDQTYDIDFNPGNILDARISVEVVGRNGNVIVPRGVTSGRFRYRAQTPGSIVFRQYINDKLVYSVDAEVVDLPLPVVEQLVKDGDDAIVTTISYGRVAGRLNEANLKVKDGENAADPEKVGKVEVDEKTQKVTQRWRIRRLEKRKPLEFSCYVLDQRGSNSGYKERQYKLD